MNSFKLSFKNEDSGLKTDKLAVLFTVLVTLGGFLFLFLGKDNIKFFILFFSFYQVLLLFIFKKIKKLSINFVYFSSIVLVILIYYYLHYKLGMNWVDIFFLAK